MQGILFGHGAVETQMTSTAFSVDEIAQRLRETFPCTDVERDGASVSLTFEKLTLVLRVDNDRLYLERPGVEPAHVGSVELAKFVIADALLFEGMLRYLPDLVAQRSGLGERLAWVEGSLLAHAGYTIDASLDFSTGERTVVAMIHPLHAKLTVTGEFWLSQLEHHMQSLRAGAEAFLNALQR